MRREDGVKKCVKRIRKIDVFDMGHIEGQSDEIEMKDFQSV